MSRLVLSPPQPPSRFPGESGTQTPARRGCRRPALMKYTCLRMSQNTERVTVPFTKERRNRKGRYDLGVGLCFKPSAMSDEAGHSICRCIRALTASGLAPENRAATNEHGPFSSDYRENKMLTRAIQIQRQTRFTIDTSTQAAKPLSNPGSRLKLNSSQGVLCRQQSF